MTPEEHKQAAIEAVLRMAKLLSASMSEIGRAEFYDQLCQEMRGELPAHWDNDE